MGARIPRQLLLTVAAALCPPTAAPVCRRDAHRKPLYSQKGSCLSLSGLKDPVVMCLDGLIMRIALTVDIQIKANRHSVPLGPSGIYVFTPADSYAEISAWEWGGKANVYPTPPKSSLTHSLSLSLSLSPNSSASNSPPPPKKIMLLKIKLLFRSEWLI